MSFTLPETSMRKRAACVQHPLWVCARKDPCAHASRWPLAYISNPDLSPKPHTQISNCQFNSLLGCPVEIANTSNRKYIPYTATSTLFWFPLPPKADLSKSSPNLLPPSSALELRMQTQGPLMVPPALFCHHDVLPGFLSESVLNLLTVPFPQDHCLVRVDITSYTDCGLSLCMGLWVSFLGFPHSKLYIAVGGIFSKCEH